MKKKITQSEKDFRISKPVEENVAQVEENKQIPTKESDATQPDSNSLVKPEDCKVQKRTMKEVTEDLKAKGYISSKDFDKEGYTVCENLSSIFGGLFDQKIVHDDDLIEINENDLNEDEKNTSIEERVFASSELIKELGYRGIIIKEGDKSSKIRAGIFKHYPNLQELEKWGLVVNYDRYNELLDNGAIDPTVNNLLTIPAEVSQEIKERQEHNFPAAMQRYGDEIHITGKESSLELQDIGIIVDHSAIVEATKDKEDEYNRNLEKLTKKILPK